MERDSMGEWRVTKEQSGGGGAASHKHPGCAGQLLLQLQPARCCHPGAAPLREGRIGNSSQTVWLEVGGCGLLISSTMAR